MKENKIRILGFVCVSCILIIAILSFFMTNIFDFTINFNNATVLASQQIMEEQISAIHIQTPEQVKAIYMTSWVAGTKYIRDRLIKLIDETELNSIVIDIKDYTGKIAFAVQDENLTKYDAVENRIPDIKELIELLHSKGVYVIGRISVFQDPHLVKQRPDLAVKKNADGEIWKDYKGISWLDASAVEVWDYVVNLTKESYKIGFDEINFDYVRFPSDGNMKEIYYPLSGEKVANDPEKGKAKIMQEFFAYSHNKLNDIDVVLSVDFFGMTTTNDDDLNIGQILEYALPFFDFICPMVYPSHYPATFIGLSNPAEHPYAVVKYSMGKAVGRIQNASSTISKLRPWLQDFDMGADYTAEMVRAQIQATYDSGLNSWMLWSAANQYTRNALELE
ncbi:MAG: putative glycoside hydrolase [Patescibacteria group bacterium]